MSGFTWRETLARMETALRPMGVMSDQELLNTFVVQKPGLLRPLQSRVRRAHLSPSSLGPFLAPFLLPSCAPSFISITHIDVSIHRGPRRRCISRSCCRSWAQIHLVRQIFLALHYLLFAIQT